MMGNYKTAFICGWPAAHSRSPIIHKYWLQLHNLEGDYIKQPVSPADFPEFIRSLNTSEYVGGNVTLPHKETAFDLIENLDPVAKRLGAVNTIWLDNGKIYGANTDGYGFLANLDQFAHDWDSQDKQQRTAIILGAGGAARAIIDALVSRGYSKIKIVNRTIARAENLAGLFGAAISAHGWQELGELMPDAGLLVNTTSLGMEGKPVLEIDLAPLPDDALVHDIVYVPLQTALLEQASLRGLNIVDGLGMLLHQAVPGFEKWFGKRPEVSNELRELVIQDLAKTT